MKHWKEGSERCGNDCGIIFGDEDRAVFIIYPKNGVIVFQEECDGYFTASKTKEEAIEALQEAIDWIKTCE